MLTSSTKCSHFSHFDATSVNYTRPKCSHFSHHVTKSIPKVRTRECKYIVLSKVEWGSVRKTRQKMRVLCLSLSYINCFCSFRNNVRCELWEDFSNTLYGFDMGIVCFHFITFYKIFFFSTISFRLSIIIYIFAEPEGNNSFSGGALRILLVNDSISYLFRVS